MRCVLAVAATSFVSLVALTGVAHAAADGGWAETNTNLAIRPEGDAKERQIGDNEAVMLVQMPVTKRVTRVTLGDLRHGCDAAPVVQLKVEHHADGDPWGTYNSRTISTSNVALSSVPDKATWDIPPTTMRGGQAYVFRVKVISGCSDKLYVTTWAHPGGAFGGDAPCPVTAADVGWWRGPHLQGSPANGCDALKFNASMPSGWLAVKPCVVGTCREVETQRFAESPTGPCVVSGNSEFGGSWVYWRQSPVNPERNDYVCMWDQYAPPGVSPEAPGSRGWHYATGWFGNDVNTPPLRRGAPRDMYLTLETVDYGALIYKHSPMLLYDSNESYFADRADTATDAPQNRLIRRYDGSDPEFYEFPGGIQLLADHSLAPPRDLSIELINRNYPNAFPVETPDTDDVIAYSGDNQQVASDLHANPYYAHVVYGRARHGGDGKLWLQYWLWYYYNSFEHLTMGPHEGDWELVQVGLDGANQPDLVTYATHEDGQTCNFDVVRDPVLSDTPRVWVADGSHASYTYAGSTLIPNRGGATDQHWGNGYVVKPSVDLVTGEIGQIWGWPGHWGESDGVASSPIAPQRQQPRWDDPSEFADDAGDCEALVSGSRKRAAPTRRPKAQIRLPKPAIRLRRHGDRVRVRYDLNTRHPLARDLYVRVVTHSQDLTQPARSTFRRLTAPAGRLDAAIPHGEGPYRVEVRLWDRRNRYGPGASGSVR